MLCKASCLRSGKARFRLLLLTVVQVVQGHAVLAVPVGQDLYFVRWSPTATACQWLLVSTHLGGDLLAYCDVGKDRSIIMH